ncbi:MAG: hypothetical protein V4700_05965 [Pseudomonadota bacterium]
MALENIQTYIVSSGFWRLMALVDKRLLSIAKIFSKLPFFFIPLLYLLHFLRAGLRVVNYFRNTKNKNLGETRKLLFSMFKMAIAIAAFVLCWFVPIPLALGSTFLLYSIIKLVDSGGVLFFSFVAHFTIDKNLLENKWRQDQYWDNIIKHISILAIGVATTLLTAIFLAGGVAAIVWTSPVIVLSLAIASAVTVVATLYLCGLFYQHSKVNDENPNLKTEYNANIKKFGKLYFVWLLSLALVAVPIVISILCPLAPAVWIVVEVLLTIFNVIDLVKSTYDYFDSTKVPGLKPASQTPKNSLIDVSVNDYYYRKNRIIYLDPINSQANEAFLTKEALVKLLEFRYKLPSFVEKRKIKVKKMGVINDIASLMYCEGTEEELVNALIQGIIALNEDKHELEDGNSHVNLKTKKIIENINDLEDDLAELLDRMRLKISANNKNESNFLINLWVSFKEQKFDTTRSAYFQSFLKCTADSQDFSEACGVAKEIKQETVHRRSK